MSERDMNALTHTEAADLRRQLAAALAHPVLTAENGGLALVAAKEQAERERDACREANDVLAQQRNEAQAACAALTGLLPQAYHDGQHGAATDLTKAELWERSDTYYELTHMTNPGQALLDMQKRLDDDALAARILAGSYGHARQMIGEYRDAVREVAAEAAKGDAT